MTLVVAIPADDAVVLASDSQATMGAIRRPGDTKIFQLGTHIAWGAAGQLSVIQKVQENLAAIPAPMSLATAKPHIEAAVWSGFMAVLQSDSRMRIAGFNPAEVMNQYNSVFLFAAAQSSASVLTVNGSGGSSWAVNGPEAIGSGDIFAKATFHKYANKQLNVDEAKLLAYKAISEAIAVAAFGLGHPINVWVVNQDGARRLEQEELMALSDDDRVLRETEVRLLVKH